MSYFNDVGTFHAKFERPVVDRGPVRLMDPEEFAYRLKFLNEELAEFYAAHEAGDLVQAADALADLVWVALGTAHHMSVPFDLVWSAVRRANNAKILAPPEDAAHKRGAVERIRKPPGWHPPHEEIELAFAIHNAIVTGSLVPSREGGT